MFLLVNIAMLEFTVMTLAAILAVSQSAPYYYSDQCYFYGRTVGNGERFTIPGHGDCFKYMCDRGRIQLVEEGCEHNGRCHNIGSTFEADCITYSCSKNEDYGRTYYGAEVVQTLCKDYYGHCRRPGETFSYAFNGILYNRCTCNVWSNQVNINCRGYKK